MKEILRKVSAVLLRPLNGGGSFFIFTSLLLLLVLLPVLVFSAPVVKVSGWSLVEALADAYVLAWVLSWLPRTPRRLLQGLSVGLLLIASVADVFVKLHFQSFISPAMLRLVLDTRPDESWSFITSYVLQWSTLVLLLPFMVWGAVWLVYVRYYRKIAVHIPRSCRTCCTAVVALLLLVGEVGLFPVKLRTCRVMAASTLSDFEVRYGDNSLLSLYSPVHRILSAMRSVSLAEDQIVGLRLTHERLQASRTASAVPKVVVIIGESYNRTRSGLYGYRLPTTPHQNLRKERGELFPFTDVVSCWNLTSYVFQNIFSLHSVDSRCPWQEYPLFPAVYKKAGYRVSFFSSQFPLRATNSVSTFAGSFFLNDAVLNRQLFDVRNYSIPAPVDDADLLTAYDSLHHAAPYDLTVFSLIGMHFNYDERIPSEKWKTFSESDYRMIRSERADRQILADYDNATRYNDHIVNEIIRRVESDDALVVYCPDHGEELFEGTGVWGRTYPDVLSKAEMHNQFEIPFWIWCSSRFRQTRPETVQRIRQSLSRPFMTDDLPHLLLDLTGVWCPDFNPARSPLRKEFRADRKRILRGWQEYEK